MYLLVSHLHKQIPNNYNFLNKALVKVSLMSFERMSERVSKNELEIVK